MASVTWTNPGAVLASIIQTATNLVTYAGDYINSLLARPIDWDIKITINSAVPTANGNSDTALAGFADGRHQVMPVGAYESVTGIEKPGFDSIINMNPKYLTTYYLDPTPSSADDVPPNQHDTLGTFLHEMLHGIGFRGYTDWATGVNVSGFEMPFDRKIILKDGKPYFAGVNAIDVYGRDVPLTIGNLFHVGNSTGDGSELSTDIMNGFVAPWGPRRTISPLDLAILADLGIGTIRGEKLFGSSGSDDIAAGGGDDTVFASAGSDVIDGGAGIDTADYGDKTLAVSVRLAGAANAGVKVDGLLDDTIRNIENVSGGSGNDELTGDGLANLLNGGGGNDALKGGGGGDTLDGDLGNDTLDGGTGHDTLDGGSGIDVASYASSGAGVTVNLAVSGAQNTVGAGVDSLVRIERLLGSAFGDILMGNAGANFLSGGAGNDKLYGRAGNDTLEGHDGNDRLDGGAGVDTMKGGTGNDSYFVDTVGDVVVELAAGGKDAVYASVDYVLAGLNVEVLSADSATGTAAIDLTGNAQANTLYGNAGNNILDGRGGSDSLRGYGGADSFVFRDALGSVDKIADFSVADDTIRLENTIFNAIEGTGILTAAQFRANATGKAEDSSDRIVYETDTGKLFYDTNGIGAGGAVQFGLLSSGLALTKTDFFIT
jgi:Ca2+-binding RTX toxin-like protein